MPTTHPSGETFTKNLVELIAPEYDGIANASNVIKPSLGIDVSIDYPNIHTLGSEVAEDPSFDTSWSNGSESTSTGNGEIHLLSTAGAYDYVVKYSNGLTVGKTYIVECIAKDNTYDGQTFVINDGSVNLPVFTIENGRASAVFVAGDTDRWEFGRSGITDIIFIDYSIREVTIPSNAYNAYYDIATQKFVQIANESDAGSSSVEYANNAEFTNNTDGWAGNNAGSALTWNAGSADFSMTSDWSYQRQSPTASASRDCRLASIANITSISDMMHIGLGTSGANVDTTGVFTYVDDVSTGPVELQIRPTVVGLHSCTLEYLRVREVLPISTTYNMAADHQLFMTMNQALTTADLAALDANPNLLFDVWFNGAVLPSGFAKANMVNFPAGNEGVASAEFVQDLVVSSVDIKELSNMSDGDTSTLVDNGDGTYTYTVQGLTNEWYPRLILKEGGGVGQELTYNFTLTLVSGVDATSFARYYGTVDVVNGSQLGTHSTTTVTANELDPYISFDGSSGLTSVYLLSNVSVMLEESPAYEINNYEAAVRADNGTVGATNLLLEQDGSGRAIAIVPPYSIEPDATQNVNTGWKPNFSTYSTQEVVTGELADLDASGVDLGTTSYRTEVRTLVKEQIVPPLTLAKFTTDGNEFGFTITGADGSYTIDGGTPVAISDGVLAVGTAAAGVDVVVSAEGATSIVFDTGKKVLTTAEVDCTGFTSCEDMFYYQNILTDILISNITSTTTIMTDMFAYCRGLTSLTLESIDTSKVTSFNRTFAYVDSLLTLDTTILDTSSATDFNSMFYGASKLTYIDLSSFDLSLTTSLQAMFSGCLELTDSILLEIASLDTSHITDFGHLFNKCPKLTKIEGINTSAGTNFGSMLRECDGLTSLSLIDMDTSSGLDFSSMFYACDGLVSSPCSLDTSSGTNFRSMFGACDSLTTPITDIDTSSGTDFSSMYTSSDGITNADLSGLDLSSGINFSSMFKSCDGLINPVVNINAPIGENFDSMFSYCENVVSFNLQNLNTPSGTSFKTMFSNSASLISVDLTSMNVSSGIEFTGMFKASPKLETVNLSNVDASSGINFDVMFEDCIALTTVDFTNFNASSGINFTSMFDTCSLLDSIDFSTANLSSGETFYNMFYRCAALSSVKFTGHTLANALTFKYMFYGCKEIVNIDLSSVTAPKVTDFNYMFRDCEVLPSLDLSSLTATAGLICSNIFYHCDLIEHIKLDSFAPVSATDLSGMFRYCDNLKCISHMDTTSPGANKNTMFTGCSSLVQPDATAQADLMDTDGADWTNPNPCPAP